MHFEIMGIVSQLEKTEGDWRKAATSSPAPPHGSSSGHTQKPSSARPTQLNANIEQTTAATDAKVAIVFADRITKTFCGKQSNSVHRLVLNDGENSPR